MNLSTVGIVLLNNTRGKAYLQNMLKNELMPVDVILLESKSVLAEIPILPEYKNLFDPNEDVRETLKKYDLSYRKIQATDCNDPLVIEALKASPATNFIYSGGGILKKNILNLGKKFIHIHPGITPRFRGSTCFYYSIIAEKKCGATAFFMAEALDTGNVLAQKEYNPPTFKDMDNIFDPWMRSDLLVEMLKNDFDEKKQSEKGAETYFIIHPVLKSLAISFCILQKK